MKERIATLQGWAEEGRIPASAFRAESAIIISKLRTL